MGDGSTGRWVGVALGLMLVAAGVWLVAVPVTRSDEAVEIAPWEDGTARTIAALWLLAGAGTVVVSVVGATGWPARTTGLLTIAAGASVALCLGSSTWRQFYWLRGEPARLAGASLVACFIGAIAWNGAPLGTRLQRPGCLGQLVIVLAALVGGLTLLLGMGSSESYRETVAAGMDGSDYMFLGLHEFLLPWAMILAAIAGALVAPPVAPRDTEVT